MLSLVNVVVTVVVVVVVMAGLSGTHSVVASPVLMGWLIMVLVRTEMDGQYAVFAAA